jgi:hypothetical protein
MPNFSSQRASAPLARAEPSLPGIIASGASGNPNPGTHGYWSRTFGGGWLTTSQYKRS